MHRMQEWFRDPMNVAKLNSSDQKYHLIRFRKLRLIAEDLNYLMNNLRMGKV